MQITKRSDLFDRDLTSQLLTNLEGQLSFKNMNKIEWNNLPPEAKAEFFMRHVFHDGVDPRIKDRINGKVNEQMDSAKSDLLKKVDNEVRNKAMVSVIQELVNGLSFDEI
jgi:hypothetical protein